MFSVDFGEVDTIVDDDGLELSERSVYEVAHNSLCCERYFVSTLDDDGFACIDIHTLTGANGLDLECAKTFYLY